jgi:FtsP/CotA-like multicopper oxidase with cupredoxin domain
MTTATLLEVDLGVCAVTALAALGGGVLALSGRSRWAVVASLVAAAGLIAWIVTVVVLAGRGWWFVQDRVMLSLPLTTVAMVAGAIITGPALRRAAAPDAVDGGAPHPDVGVALLGVGYAALTGLVVPLLVGYPASWSVVLVSVAVVGLAVKLTRRVVTPVADAPPHAALRSPIGVTTFTISLLAVSGIALAFRPAPSTDLGGGPAAAHDAISVNSLVGPDPATAPAGTPVRRFTLTARSGPVRLSSGRTIAAWTFNGQAPGPALTVNQGDLVEVTLENADIAAGVTIHWHGYDVPGAEDGAPGVTQDAVAPGQTFVYRFLAKRTGTYWYHTHEVSDQGVRMGLYGAFVVLPSPAPPAGLDLTLPIHTFSGAVAIGDDDRPDVRSAATGTAVRLRMINTDSVTHRITVAGAAYRLDAIDGTGVNQPGVLGRTGLRLAAGGRYDLTFTMPATTVSVMIDDASTGGLRLTPPGVTTVAPPDTTSWPDLDLGRYGAPAAAGITVGSHFNRQFTLVLDQGLAFGGGTPSYDYTVNGEAYPSTATMVVHQGDLVLMTVVNRSLTTHPWHLHGHRVLVLSINGRTTTGSPLWMDTFEVRPGEVWQVAFRADNPGIWMNHCHNLSHADKGMMLLLRYDGVTSDAHGGHGG